MGEWTDKKYRKRLEGDIKDEFNYAKGEADGSNFKKRLQDDLQGEFDRAVASRKPKADDFKTRLQDNLQSEFDSAVASRKPKSDKLIDIDPAALEADLADEFTKAKKKKGLK